MLSLTHNGSLRAVCRRVLHQNSKTIIRSIQNCNSNPVVEQKSSTSCNSWIGSSFIPESVRPYLHLCRADKQAGTMLLLWPCIWGVSLAAPLGSLPDPVLISQFAVGALVMRGAGCTINDMFDKNFDKFVERTKNRPLADGTLNMKQAFGFLTAQLLCGLGVLVSFNTTTIMLGMASMPLVVMYPLMKRVTNWPQLILGLAFNWGALVGWTAVHDSISWEQVLPLYGSGVCWTLVYDTLYGYQDRKDDAKLGLKSTALHLGDYPQKPLSIIAGLSTAGLAAAGYLADLSWPFYLGTAAVSTHLLWQIWSANINNPQNLWYRFNSNKYLGGLVAASIIAGHF